MPQFNFGSGLLFAPPISGVGPAFAFGTLQDVAVEMDRESKTMYGSNDHPDIAAFGKSKTTVKAKFGQVSGSMYNALFYGGTASAGMVMFQQAEAQTIPSAGAYTVNATYASGSGILAASATDLAVRYAVSGAALVNSGATAPAQGQYQVSNGVYTFAAADAGAPVLLTYTYRTTAAGTGTTYTRNQQVMGTSIYFSLFLTKSFNGLQSNMKFFRAMCTKLAEQTKNDDFMVPEMDFTIFADPANRVFERYDATA
jgi:hypothetical protein